MAKIRNSGTIINTDYLAGKLIEGSITDLVIPSSATAIRAYAFQNNTTLLSVYIPKSVKSIGTDAFKGCSQLNNAVFEENGVEIINAYCFARCNSLREIRLPNGLTTLGAQVFDGMASLKKIIIPKTLVNIDRFQTVGSPQFSYLIIESSRSFFGNGSNYAFAATLLRLLDIRNAASAYDLTGSGLTANSVTLYINVPDNHYDEFTAFAGWNKLNLKQFVHSCDAASFEDIQNPIEGDYYSLKGDTNYLNPLGEKQIIIKQFANGEWLEVDIDA